MEAIGRRLAVALEDAEHHHEDNAQQADGHSDHCRQLKGAQGHSFWSCDENTTGEARWESWLPG